jgi:hypothetical protein
MTCISFSLQIVSRVEEKKKIEIVVKSETKERFQVLFFAAAD